MGVIKSIVITFSMFSRIPMPRTKWEEKNMRYAISFLPLISIPIGLPVLAWIAFVQHTGFYLPFFYAAVLTVIPVLVTGGIHLDGFADTVDGLSSRASMERKKEILKDPHAGAFAVIGLCVYFLLYAGLCNATLIHIEEAFRLFLCYFGARITGSMAVLCLPSSGSKGLLDTFKSASYKGSIAVGIIFAAIFCGAVLILDLLFGALMIAVCILCLIYIAVMSKRQFGGMSGDLAGYIIQICELLLIGVVVLTEYARLI